MYTRTRSYVQTTKCLRTIVPLDIPIHISAPMHRFLSHPMQYITYLLYSYVRILSRTMYKTYIIIIIIYDCYYTRVPDEITYRWLQRLENKTKYIFRFLLLNCWNGVRLQTMDIRDGIYLYGSALVFHQPDIK